MLSPHARFDTLVVGAANRLAVTAARAVAESPGAVYNPLFIYARPGLGKTHLLMAIGHGARLIDPNRVVEYLTLDDFVEGFNAAVAAGQGDLFRRRFAEVDVLLVDDVQFLTQRREMQAELLRITDALQAASRQIVLTSDRPPSEIEALDERLIRRFAGGLSIDVAGPDYETRVAILRRRAEERRVAFADGVLEAVGRLEIDNVRELLGALNRMIAYQAVSAGPLDAAGAVALVAPLRDRAALVEHVRVEAADEFGDFLSEIHATVSQQVDAWRASVTSAIDRYRGEGYRVERLAALLAQDLTSDPEAALTAFAEDVRRLEELRREAVALAPELASGSGFHDPDDLGGAQAALDRARATSAPPPGPSQTWRLADLVEVPASRMAFEAARSALEDPGARYNPLVIAGAAATGKTHLLHAVGNELRTRVDGPIACLSAAEFSDELITAIDREQVDAWRARYRRCSAFLLDDVHLIAGRDRTQDELFVLFNTLAQSGRQMIFTCAGTPGRMEGIEPRLLTRLEGGLVVELPPATPEVRIAVVSRALRATLGASDEELAEYLASHESDSVRDLEAVVERVLSAAGSAGEAVPTAAFARQLLEGGSAATSATHTRLSTGVPAPSPGGLRSREKLVWEWPSVGDRIVEEWR